MAESSPDRTSFKALVGTAHCARKCAQISKRSGTVHSPRRRRPSSREPCCHEWPDCPGLYREDHRTNQLLKAGLMDKRRKIIPIRLRQRRVKLIDPLDRKFERATRINARRTNIRLQMRLRLRVGRENFGPFGMEKPKVRHSVNKTGIRDYLLQ